jgi:hypothetical protein
LGYEGHLVSWGCVLMVRTGIRTQVSNIIDVILPCIACTMCIWTYKWHNEKISSRKVYTSNCQTVTPFDVTSTVLFRLISINQAVGEASNLSAHSVLESTKLHLHNLPNNDILHSVWFSVHILTFPVVCLYPLCWFMSHLKHAFAHVLPSAHIFPLEEPSCSPAVWGQHGVYESSLPPPFTPHTHTLYRQIKLKAKPIWHWLRVELPEQRKGKESYSKPYLLNSV